VNDGEDEEVHVAPADLPVGPVERQRPVAAQPEHLADQRQRPVGSEIDMLEEPLQPAVGRGDLHAPRTLAGDVAEVDRPGADHADHEKAERLQTGLAQVDTRPQNRGEGGDGSVMHPDVPLVGVVQKITSSRPQPDLCRVVCG